MGATVSDAFCACGMITHYEEPRSTDCKNACKPDENCLTDRLTRFVTCWPGSTSDPRGLCTTAACPVDIPSCANGLPCPLIPQCTTFKQSGYPDVTGCTLPCSNSNECPPKADGPGIAGCYRTGFHDPSGREFSMCGWGDGSDDNVFVGFNHLHTNGTVSFHNSQNK